MDGGAWWAAVHGVARSRTRLSDFTFTFHFHALEKEMATHSSVLAWRIPGTGGAWWAAIYGVAQSRTRLKRLSSSSSLRVMCIISTFQYRLGCAKFSPVPHYCLFQYKVKTLTPLPWGKSSGSPASNSLISPHPSPQDKPPLL